MRFLIRHSISYRYSQPVFIEPTIIRLKPRCDNRQNLIHFELNINPEPQIRTEAVDLEGTDITQICFADQYRSLQLEAVSEVETLNDNPFDFIFSQEKYTHLPMEYPSSWDKRVQLYRVPGYSDGDIRNLTEELLEASRGKTLDFLIRLTQSIHQDFKKVSRDQGHPLTPLEILKTREGACRDLTVLFLEICRQVGLAGRYVSGYTRGDDRVLDRELHAWAEIYLPGGGWRGFDPTLGLAVADHHVVLAASAEPAHTLPTEGTFRGTGAQAQIQYEVRVQVEETHPS